MNKSLSIDEVNDLIASGAPDALAALQALPSPCVQDSRQETPFNVAVRHDNQAVIDWLVTQADALNFAPRLDEDLVDPVGYTVAAALDPNRYEKTEKYLVNSFGPNICWQRTPLLTACRWGKGDVVKKLLAANADTQSADVLGLTALELCRASRDPELAQLLLGDETSKKRAIKVTETLLQSALKDPDEYRHLVAHGNLTAGAKRFAFQIACALLDRDGAKSLLDNGLKLNSAFNNESNPLLEAAFSMCLDIYEHPDSADKAIGQRMPKAIQIDNDAILNAESLEDIERLFASAETESRPVESKGDAGPAMQERINFIHWLVAQGLDLEKARGSGSPFYLQDVIHSGSADLLKTLQALGFSMAPEEKGDSSDVRSALEREHFEIVYLLLQLGHSKADLEASLGELWSRYESWKKGNRKRLLELDLPQRQETDRRQPDAEAVEWQLAGESMLTARLIPEVPPANSPFSVELVHDNVYGPDDETQFQLRVAGIQAPNDAAAGEDDSGDWLPTRKTAELVMTDDGWTDRAEMPRKWYEETPWQATFVTEMKLPAGRHRLEIRVVSSREGMNGILSDWEVRVV